MNNALKGEFILNDMPEETTPVGVKNGPQVSPTTKGSQTPHFYSSFCQNPAGVSFSEQENNETILLLLRRHFVTNLPWIMVAIFLLILPVAFPFFSRLFPFPLPTGHTLALYLSFYYLVLFGFVLINFTLWYFQVGLVTNTRVIDVDLSGILYRQISEAKNQNIEDVTYNQIGFMRSLFNYGNVLVQTAGSEENIEYDRVPRPSKVSDILGNIPRPI